MHDLQSPTDVITLVDSFYAQVRQDELIGPIFENVIGDHWQLHLEKMYRFWGSVLFQEGSYHGSPFPPHAVLNIDERHFERWLQLFQKTLQLNFKGPLADKAYKQACKMAQLFLVKLSYYRSRPGSQPLV